MQEDAQHAALSISLLGTFDVNRHGVLVTTIESDRVRALLSFLAVESDRPHRREFLAALLWPNRPDSTARRNLRQALYNLRQAIEMPSDQEPALPGSSHLMITPHVAQFDPASDYWLDVRAFCSLLEGCPTHATGQALSAYNGDRPADDPGPARHSRDNCPACVARLEKAVDLYREGFLAGLTLDDSEEFEKWRTLKEQHFHRQMIESLTRLANYYERRGDYARSALALQRQISLEPWREEAHRHRMRVLALGGQRSAALAQYNDCRQILQVEFNSSPAQETTDLYLRIQSGQVSPQRIAGSSPYKGLQAFSEADAADFYGREAAVEQLIQTIKRQQVVAVIGPSGSGKSSLVYAGLLPYLRMSGAWAVASLRPGANPFRQIAATLASLLDVPSQGRAALAEDMEQGRHSLAQVVDRIRVLHPQRTRPGTSMERRLLIVIDALEELHTLCVDPARRHAFLDLLLGPIAGQPVETLPYALLFTLRADFFEQALSYPGMANVLTNGYVLLGPMGRDKLRQAIEEPAKARGVAFEAGLVARLLEDVGSEPGNLPLLQFTLTRLWEQQHDSRLTHAAYDKMGGVAGALTGYAEDVYARLDPDEQKDAHLALTRMVRSGQGTQDTRRPVTRDEFSERQWRLVQKLADARLVVTGRDTSGIETAEIVHEALIQTWKRMRAWMEVDLFFHSWLGRLRTAIEQWELCGQDEGGLLRGGPLAEAEEWIASRATDLSQAQQEFVAASIALREREQAAAEAQLERERAQGRALQRAVQLSSSLRLAANARLALRNLDTDLALALALEANRIADPPSEAQRVLAEAAYTPGTRCLYQGHDVFVRCLAVSPDRRTALSGAADHTLILWDLSALAIDLAGEDALSRPAEHKAGPTTGHMIHRLRGHDDTVYCVAYAPDGRMALSGSGDSTLIQWDLESGRPIRRFYGHGHLVFGIAYHPDGRRALSGSFDRSLILWDLVTGQIIHHLEGHQGDVWSVAISPDGQTALSGAGDGSVIFWDLESGRPIHHRIGQASADDALPPRAGHTACVRGVAFGPTENTALSVSEDRSVILWDLERADILHRFEMLGARRLYSLDLSPNKRRALIGTRDGPPILLDLSSRHVFESAFGHMGRIEAVVFAGDRHALSGAANGDVRLSDLYSGAEIHRLQYDRTRDNVTGIDVSPDGRRGLTSFDDGSTVLWNAASLDRRFSHVSDPDEVRWFMGSRSGLSGGVRFMPDGRRAISGASDVGDPVPDNSLRLWDLEAGVELGRFAGHSRHLTAVVPCPDACTVLSASADGTVRRWDLSLALKASPSTALDVSTEHCTGEIVHDASPQTVQAIAVHPDGRTVLIGLGERGEGFPDYALRLVELDTGRLVRRLEGPENPIEAVSISPDGQQALSGSVDGTVLLWDLGSGQVVRRLEGHTSGVRSIAFSPQGRSAVTGSRDGSVVLWDVATGEAVRRYRGHQGEVIGVCIAQEGRTILSAGADLTVREWRIDARQEELLAWIRENRYVAELTPEQHKRYDVDLLDGLPGAPADGSLL